jgi:hypothetical protein
MFARTSGSVVREAGANVGSLLSVISPGCPIKTIRHSDYLGPMREGSEGDNFVSSRPGTVLKPWAVYPPLFNAVGDHP